MHHAIANILLNSPLQRVIAVVQTVHLHVTAQSLKHLWVMLRPRASNLRSAGSPKPLHFQRRRLDLSLFCIVLSKLFTAIASNATPGSYRVGEYWRHISTSSALCNNGRRGGGGVSTSSNVRSHLSLILSAKSANWHPVSILEPVK